MMERVYAWGAVERHTEGLGQPLQPTLVQAKVANGPAQTHWVDIALGLPPVPEQTQSYDWPRDSQASQKHDITSLAALIWILKPARKRKARRGDWPGWLEPACVIEQLEGVLMGQIEGSVEDLRVCLLYHPQSLVGIVWRISVTQASERALDSRASL